MNQTHISPLQVAERCGIQPSEAVWAWMYEPKVPACCSEGCLIEDPNGYCEHGNQSAIKEMLLNYGT